MVVVQATRSRDLDPIARAAKAAEQLFESSDDAVAPAFEPRDAQEARAAVRRLGELLEDLPGPITKALDAARGSGTLLSSDRLQGLAEIVQNADDVEASEVRLLLRPTELLVSHNGNPVRLDHVLGLATPWLSTKTGDASAIGRFGVGLTTLQSLSPTLEVHCAPYHVRIGDPSVAPLDPPALPPGFGETGWTTLRLPLQPGTLESTELEAWLDRWGDASLLFLRTVARVRLLEPNAGAVRELALSRRGGEDLELGAWSAVSRVLSEAKDGRAWAVYSAAAPAPRGFRRALKATGVATPIAVALPLRSVGAGHVYAGLPVAATPLPLFANAQFDPITSRADFADTPWNKALAPLVAELWSEAALDLFARDPKTAWDAMPTPDAGEARAGSPLVRILEGAVLARARQSVASRLSFPVPGRGDVSVSRLAVEEEPLEGILREDETARLAGLSSALPSGVRDHAGRWRSVLDDWRENGADLPEPVSVERALDVVGDETRPAGSTIALVAAALQEGLHARLLELPCVIARDGRRIAPPSRTSASAVAAEPTPLAEELGLVTLLHHAHLASAHGAPAVLAWLSECGALLDAPDDRAVVYRLAAAGRAGRAHAIPLTDAQACALRDAFQLLDEDDRAKLGPDVGRAVSLESFTYDEEGGKKIRRALPGGAYLPRKIERGPGSFAVAAGKSRDSDG